MKLAIAGSLDEAAQEAARRIDHVVARRPDAVIGLATGATMGPVHEHLSALDPDLSQVTFVQLDEYLGLPIDDRQSFRFELERLLLDGFGLAREQLVCFEHIGDMSEPDQISESCRRHTAAIDQLGGLDLQLVGIGRNGHIGFNEPGSPFDSRCRCVELVASTRDDNGQLAERAITLGIGDILAAREVVLVATGARKAEAVRAAFTGRTDERVPASALQRHPDATIILDRRAAAHLTDLR